MTAAHRLRVGARVQPLERVLADRLQHDRPRLAAVLLLPHQALVDQRLEPVQHVDAQVGAAADRLDVLERRRRPRTRPGARTAAAPARRAGRGSRRSRRAASAAGRGDRARPTAAGRAGSARRARIAAGGSSLTRAAASSIASGSPSRRAQISATAGAFSLVTANPGLTATARSMNSRTASYCDTRSAGAPRIGERQRRHRHLLLARDAQRAARRDDHLEARAGADQIGDQRRRGQHLLEVVHHQQRLPIAKVLQQPVARRALPGLEVQGLHDRRAPPARDR